MLKYYIYHKNEVRAMRTYAPDYYTDFKCIAQICRHNCCIGWEIDIDDKAFDFYKEVKGEFKSRLLENIEDGHFKLLGNERCPFLNGNNLCDIIINLGENALCDICNDHPRFRNFFDTRTEIGLGLCCEEAGRIILSNTNKVRIKALTSGEDYFSEDEEIFFNFRNKIFNIVQDRTYAVKARISRLLSEFKITLPNKTTKEWTDIFLSLERLDKAWDELLLNAEDSCEFLFSRPEFELPTEQLLVYFLYRHLADCMYDGKASERILFSVLSLMMISLTSSAYFKLHKHFEMEDLIEVSRMYSSEIEYSEENINSLLELL